MQVHILQATVKGGLRANKDTNGGYGTVNDFGSGLAARTLKLLKRGTMNYPEILPAYLIRILKDKGHTVTYGLDAIDPGAELVILQTSIVNYSEELKWAEKTKQLVPGARLGFVGGMAASNPNLYAHVGDFVITGEAENVFMHQDIADLKGVVNGGYMGNLDNLPFPDWSHIRKWRSGYGFLKTSKGRLLPSEPRTSRLLGPNSESS